MSARVDARQVGEGVARASGRPRVTGLLAWAGIIGPILFTVAFVVQALFRPGYSHVAEPVSALAAGPNGWIQNANFLVFGPLMIAFAIGLHIAMRPTRRGVAGPALLALSGVGLMLAGLFPWALDANGDYIVPPAHIAGAYTAFLAAGSGLMVLSRRMARDPSWRSLAPYSLGSGIAVTVLFLATGPLAVPDEAPLHDWAGLMQRATVAVWFACTILLALRLLRVAKTYVVTSQGRARRGSCYPPCYRRNTQDNTERHERLHESRLTRTGRHQAAPDGRGSTEA
jgi:hypothetical membrane protein